ncbi:MDR family MFS transporter [Herbiconiux sp. SYSU D00978]|uniref:MDR family MFS transporter n=1 Tax=Herbiconiux sp. SYSU D00978 TaxID=2812562 RepID=UPI001A96E751|nr:MDR family MFS transporter [Herbiconiux sp. SYSU D00978]
MSVDESIGTGTRAETDVPERLSPVNKLVIGLLLVSAFVVILNETIMGVALPRLMEDLNVTASTATWLTTGFMLTMAVVIPATGFLLQRFNLRPVFIAAMGLFSLGTLIAAIAPGFGILLLGRIVQASGTAIMMPLLMTTVLNLVHPSHRGRVMGTISIVISVAPAIGPTVSGIILQSLSWRFMFVIVLPIAVAALVGGIRYLQNVTTPRAVAVDVLSIVLSAFAFGGLIFGLSSIGESVEGHSLLPPALPLAFGVVALGAFIWRQLVLQRRDAALLDLRTFTSFSFSLSAALLVISMIALFGTLIVLPIYLQSVLQLGALETGLLLLPGGVLMAILSPIVGRLFDRVGPRPLVPVGTIVLSITLWTMTMVLTPSTPIWGVIALHMLLSTGLAFMFTPLFTSGLGSLRRELYSHGSAIVGTVQQLAGAAGTALFVTVLSLGTVAGLAAGGDAVTATGEGVQAAFRVGAMISLVAVVGSFFVRRPKNELPAGAGGH